jgi:hypothetical protein
MSNEQSFTVCTFRMQLCFISSDDVSLTVGSSPCLCRSVVY